MKHLGLEQMLRDWFGDIGAVTADPESGMGKGSIVVAQFGHKSKLCGALACTLRQEVRTWPVVVSTPSRGQNTLWLSKQEWGV